ncbi:MAG: DUF3048 domain-containing protein [Dethiobacteria bacterium]|jgi:hypothetical protein
MTKRKSVCFLVLFFLILTFLLEGCKVHTNPEKPAADAQQSGTEENEGLKNEPPATPEELSPFTGLPASEIFNRPYAIIIENERAARPQAGLQEAELVYEAPAEGGITRFLAFFISPFEGDIGPVRSARPYFAYLADEYDGILAHCGYSIHTVAVLADLKLKHINEIPNPLYYKRLKSRKMPHNLYTSLPMLATGAEKFNYLQGSPPADFFPFAEHEKPAEIVSSIALTFNSRNSVEYRWNPQGTYTRYNDGSLFIDSNHGKPVEVKNIIIQLVNTRIFTEEGHLEITLLGEGKGFFFSGGNIKEIKWEKDSYSEKTRFSGVDGSDLRLAPGNTWIHLLPQSGKVEWQMEKNPEQNKGGV